MLFFRKQYICSVFAFDPNLAVCENFFLPNRNRAFQFANCPLAGFKRGAAVWGADRDNDAGLADFQAAGAMNDANVGDVESLVSLCSQSFHLAQSHRLLRFLKEIKRTTAPGPFAPLAA